MASTSSATPSQSTHKFIYDVFLSFSGEDIRKTFLPHLCHHLKHIGIETFKDDEQIKIGERIAPRLLEAIQESRVAIVIFSENYASSTWCLDEVATIMECKEKHDQIIVVPIFFNVEPSHVRKQTGSFEALFANHEKNIKSDEDKEKVAKWRKALKDAGEIVGHHLHGDKYKGNELDCIKGVVNDMLEKLPRVACTQEDLVGLESRLKKISVLMDVSSKDVKLVLGIWGMGGIGKTTLARAAFAKFSSGFEHTCFLADIREKHSNGKMEDMQKKLLSKLPNESSKHIDDDADEGINVIKKMLKWKRVLIVLDDVDKEEQLDKLVGDGKWLCNGSRLIITTRNKHLFSKFRVVVKRYEVEKLEEEKALELFSWHAFNNKSPGSGFEDLSKSFVSHASGLPLALKVWGSSLCEKTEKQVWVSTLEKIKKIPDEEVCQKLKISYDGLDKSCKKLFLDIACFFRHKRRDYVEDVLYGCKLHPVKNIDMLIDRCLLFESYGCINMHDSIHEMGLDIEKETRSRRWQLDDLDYEPEAVEGLLLSFTDRRIYENISPSIEAFNQMKKLEMLIVEYHVYCSKSVESSWMSIMDYLPWSLMVLKFPYYPLSKLFRTEGLKKLTYLNLNSSISLLETPNFVEMPNLERLNLSGCEKLKEIHPSIGNLMKLVFLDLRFCSNIKKLPSFNRVSSLTSLDICYCQKLKNFPEIRARTPYLLELDLMDVGIIELPSSIQQLHGLTKLCLSDCKLLRRLSNGLCELKNLKVLEITDCPRVESLPENIELLSSLEYLSLENCGFVNLAKSFRQLSHLQYLRITNCGKYKELPKLPTNIVELYADCQFALGSKIAELAAECSKLRSVSFFKHHQYVLGTSLAKKFIHFPLHRKTPLCVTYFTSMDELIEMEINNLRSFKYRRYESNGISINLNLPWYSQNFEGFVVCFLSSKGGIWWGQHSIHDTYGRIEHFVIIAKLSHKDDENKVLQTECVVAGSPSWVYGREGHICFAYIPFSSLWPESKSKMEVDDYSRFEVEFMNLKSSVNWGCSLLYKRWKRRASRGGLTTDIGPLPKLEYLNLSGRDFEHLPEYISRLRHLQYLDISGCTRLRELPLLPATLRELYANYNLASESNIAELATKYSQLYSVSFSGDEYVTLSVEELAKKFISITQPFPNRNTPFAVTYTTTEKNSFSKCFKYHSSDSNKICIDDLNHTPWYSQDFLGFVVCFRFSENLWGWESHPDIRPFRHYEVIAKLYGNEVLQKNCVIGRLYDEEFEGFDFIFDDDDFENNICFAYIPFNSLWPESKTITDDVTPNSYSIFEVAFLDLQVSTDWSCGLLYKDDELLTEAIRCKASSSDTVSGEMEALAICSFDHLWRGSCRAKAPLGRLWNLCRSLYTQCNDIID